MENYHLVVIGAGPGGYVAALRAAMNGIRTTIIEENIPGGTCLNVGCIPTKALAASAALLDRAGRGAVLGVTCRPEFDFQAAMRHKETVVSRLVKGVETLFKKRKVTLKRGRATLLGPDLVKVDTADGVEEISATHVIIATGSLPVKPGFFPFDGERIVTSEEMLGTKDVPERLLVVGGGVIGCEFASIFGAFGGRVHIVEMLPEILSMLDDDLGKEMLRAFKKAKVKVSAGTKVEKLERRGDTVFAELGNGEAVEADCALVSIGRKPNSAGLGLEEAGVETDERGFIPVDDDAMTNIANVYAAGDVTGRWLLAHAASAQGIAAADHAAGKGGKRTLDVVPSCVFTHPELASVGLSEAEAGEKGFEKKTGKFALRVLGRAQAMDELSGFVKLVGDASTGKLLGMHIAGAGASEMIHEGALALEMGATVEDLARVIHTHPTLSEGVSEAAEDFLGGAIHG